MRRVLVAGTTGHPAQFVVEALKARGHRVRALGRSPDKLAQLETFADDVFVGEVTDPPSRAGLCDRCDGR